MLKDNEIKRSFYNHFTDHMIEAGYMHFFYELFMHGSAYIVGGYFRDFLLKQNSRDIDVITDVPHELLFSIVKSSNAHYIMNKHGGLKILLDKVEIDIWTIDNNWAFKNKLVKLNEDDKLNSIAKGCFYNFDALVINLHTFNFNLRYYCDSVANNELKILQTNSIYKNLNPTVEANILRAIHLNKKYSLKFSSDTSAYLISKIGFIHDKYSDPLKRLLDIKERYPKYNYIEEIDILKMFFTIKESLNSNQLKFDL